jgi:hypothetical protein
MVAVPIPRTGQSTQLRSLSPGAPVARAKQQDWTHLVAAGTVLAGGALLLAGHKRAGLTVAAAGTALALLEEPEVLQTWWQRLPAFLADAQVFLDKIEGYVTEATAQGHRIQSILRR